MHGPVPLLHDYLRHSARQLGGKVALVCGKRRITYGEIEARSNAIAHHLVASGVARGDRVIIFADNTVETVVSFWAVLKANALNTPLLPATIFMAAISGWLFSGDRRGGFTGPINLWIKSIGRRDLRKPGNAPGCGAHGGSAARKALILKDAEEYPSTAPGRRTAMAARLNASQAAPDTIKAA